MALSNIFREPKREIIESVVGVAIVGFVLYFDWKFACWFQAQVMPTDHVFRIIGILAGLIIFMLAFGLVIFTHWVGEGVCEILKNHGLELRPNPRERGY
jgi:hypothetical protein